MHFPYRPLSQMKNGSLYLTERALMGGLLNSADQRLGRIIKTLSAPVMESSPLIMMNMENLTEYGHLFYKNKFSHYKIRLEYRFTGKQLKSGPDWGIRNNGIMFHTQSPESMEIDHGWPVSLEFQLLGGLSDGKERHTGNVCSPGTHIILNGKLDKTHCIDSNSKTYHGDQWVKAELEVKGDEYMRQYINGELVMEYKKPIADANDEEQPAHPMEDGIPITEGYIALQAETHPTEFRNILLLDLSKN